MGTGDRIRSHLAARCVDILLPGSHSFWDEAPRVPPNQRAAPPGKRSAVIPGLAENDGLPLAQRICSGTVCRASAACGVCRVDSRAKGRFEFPVLVACDASLCWLC